MSRRLSRFVLLVISILQYSGRAKSAQSNEAGRPGEGPAETMAAAHPPGCGGRRTLDYSLDEYVSTMDNPDANVFERLVREALKLRLYETPACHKNSHL